MLTVCVAVLLTACGTQNNASTTTGGTSARSAAVTAEGTSAAEKAQEPAESAYAVGQSVQVSGTVSSMGIVRDVRIFA